MAVDASDSHVGAVLQQQLHGSWAPLAFFSKKLSSAKSKYSAFDRELLTAYSTIRHFCFLLKAWEFTLFTDHKPLTLALFPSSPPWSARQTRHLAYIAEFTSNIVHIPGSKNVVADAFSRPFCLVPTSASAMPVFSTVSIDLSASNFDFLSFPALQSECPISSIHVVQTFPLRSLHSFLTFLW